MKRFTLLTFISVAFLSAMILMSGCTKEGPAGATGATGPQGPKGEDGINGTDGTAGCIECHDNTQKMFGKTIQWEASTHATGGNFERNNRDCAVCHTSQGFLGSLDGSYDPDGGQEIKNPNPINCYTCHDIHNTYTPADYDLTFTDSFVPLMGGDAVDFGNSNLCAKCHQGRSLGTAPVEDGDDYQIFSQYWGTHHAPQANIMAGQGPIEFSGSESYGTNKHMSLIDNDCKTCHMAKAYGVKAGGHTMNMTYEYHGSDVLNTAGCTECHDDIADRTKEVQDEVKALLSDLEALLVDEGIIVAGSYRPIPGTYSANVVGAYVNYQMALEDKSYGIHNPTYVIALLKNTIAKITPAP